MFYLEVVTNKNDVKDKKGETSESKKQQKLYEAMEKPKKTCRKTSHFRWTSAL